MKILVIQTAYPGDVILATAFVAEVAKRFPEAAIDIAVRTGNEDLLEGNPNIARVWTWDKGRRKERNLFRLANQLRNERFSRVYNLHRYLSSGFLAWRTNAGFRAGFDKNPFSWCYDRKVEHRIPDTHLGSPLHEVQRNSLLLDDIPGPRTRPDLHPTEEDRRIARRHSNQPSIVIAPGSVWFTKRWPESKWVELIQHVPVDIRIFIVGGSEDRALGDRLTVVRGNVHNLCGQRSWMQNAALMEMAMRVYTNDSAPLHLASGVNAPTTAIFCATRPELGFGPLSDDSRIVQSPLPCCASDVHGASKCKEGHFHCAMDIDPESILRPDLELWRIAFGLRSGQLLLQGTDTVPGLAAIATSEEAVDRIYRAKGREAGKPLLVLCADEQMAARHVRGDLPERVLRIFQLGRKVPVTVVLPDAKGLASNLLPQDGSIGIRIPAHPEVRTLVRSVGAPLASTSANRLGANTPGALDEVDHDLVEASDLRWSPMNPVERERASTVVRWTGQTFEVLREGDDMAILAPWLGSVHSS